ncbi:MAG: hypothetical protein HY927_09600 [Elusimicrobia bacterium]|nr:hypothetical protein [Elusimicrobiota bacterium]
MENPSAGERRDGPEPQDDRALDAPIPVPEPASRSAGGDLRASGGPARKPGVMAPLAAVAICILGVASFFTFNDLSRAPTPAIPALQAEPEAAASLPGTGPAVAPAPSRAPGGGDAPVADGAAAGQTLAALERDGFVPESPFAQEELVGPPAEDGLIPYGAPAAGQALAPAGPVEAAPGLAAPGLVADEAQPRLTAVDWGPTTQWKGVALGQGGLGAQAGKGCNCAAKPVVSGGAGYRPSVAQYTQGFAKYHPGYAKYHPGYAGYHAGYARYGGGFAYYNPGYAYYHPGYATYQPGYAAYKAPTVTYGPSVAGYKNLPAPAEPSCQK